MSVVDVIVDYMDHSINICKSTCLVHLTLSMSHVSGEQRWLAFVHHGTSSLTCDSENDLNLSSWNQPIQFQSFVKLYNVLLLNTKS